jgi:hypothetical protein
MIACAASWFGWWLLFRTSLQEDDWLARVWTSLLDGLACAAGQGYCEYSLAWPFRLLLGGLFLRVAAEPAYRWLMTGKAR